MSVFRSYKYPFLKKVFFQSPLHCNEALTIFFEHIFGAGVVEKLPIMKRLNGGGSIIIWNCFNNNQVENLIAVNEKLIAAKYIELVKENLFFMEKFGSETYGKKS